MGRCLTKPRPHTAHTQRGVQPRRATEAQAGSGPHLRPPKTGNYAYEGPERATRVPRPKACLNEVRLVRYMVRASRHDDIQFSAIVP